MFFGLNDDVSHDIIFAINLDWYDIFREIMIILIQTRTWITLDQSFAVKVLFHLFYEVK